MYAFICIYSYVSVKIDQNAVFPREHSETLPHFSVPFPGSPPHPTPGPFGRPAPASSPPSKKQRRHAIIGPPPTLPHDEASVTIPAPTWGGSTKSSRSM
jgi:hypothetical protein